MSKAEITKQGNDLVISGRLDFETVVDIWKKSQPLIAQESGLHFDLGQVTSSNSAGVALMVDWMRFAKEKHCAIDFKNIPSQLSSIIAVSGIKSLIATI